jgi:DNA-binding transcriptional ArsR family regulator
MRSFLAVTSALSDPNRVRVLMALRTRGELCVCQIVELLELAPSTVSKHLSLLYAAGLLDGRKQGRWMYYRLPDAGGPDDAKAALRWATAALKDDPAVRADADRLDRILRDTPEDLCKRQTARIQGRASPGSRPSNGAPKPGRPAAAGSTCCSSAPATRAAARWPRAGRGTSAATGSRPTRPA